MTLVVDASVLVAALIAGGPNAAWAESLIASDHLVAPQNVVAETANVLRRRELAASITSSDASRAHAHLLELPVVLYDYHEFASRIWELRYNVTIHDACYVALAEALDANVATLDLRLARAPGPRCAFLTPPTS